MSNENDVDVKDVLSELQDEALDTSELGTLANELVCATQEASKCEARKREIKKKIMALLDSAGLDAAVAAGRRLGFTTKTYWGLAQGQTPEERKANVEALRKWLSDVAPEVDVPASTNINKAVTAFIEDGGDPESLPFLSKQDKRSLTNRKA